jgi:hypothetical protein
MKKFILAGIILLCFVGSRSFAQEYKMGLGARFTNAQATVNNSISFRYFLNEGTALEALVSFDPFSVGGLYEIFRPLGTPGLKWFYGGGGYVSFSDDRVLGAMGIIGLDYKFQRIPLNISLDWKPELNLVKQVDFEAATVGLGVRFVF